MPPAREDRAAWLRLLKTEMAAFNDAINEVDGKYRPDLRGADLSGMDFAGRTLELTTFETADLSDSDFTGSTLRDLYVGNWTTLDRTKFDAATFLDTALSQCTGQQPSFARAQFKAGSISARFRGADFRGAEMTETELRFGSFLDCDFRGVRAHDVVLRDYDVAGSDFRGAQQFEFKDVSNLDLAKF